MSEYGRRIGAVALGLASLGFGVPAFVAPRRFARVFGLALGSGPTGELDSSSAIF